MSENEVFLGSRQTPFAPATKKGPSNAHGHLEEAERDLVRAFVALQLDNASVPNPSLSAGTVYLPLGRGEVRVLELKPGNFDDSLHGALHVVNIEFDYSRIGNYKRRINHAVSLPEGDPFWYTALSYTWGAPIFDVEFHLTHNTSIQITRTLASALKHLRSEIEGIFLWIDQICINQKSIKEKEHQIPLMGKIYSHATNTVIWLGDEGDDNPQLALDTLQTVHSRLQLLEGEIQAADFQRLKFPPLEAPEWAEVNKLFDRAWFGRLWVVQEAILSMNLYIKCGKAMVPWEDFTLWCVTMENSGLRSLVEANSPAKRTQSGLYTTYELATFRVYSQAQEAQDGLLESMVLTRYANASVSKDKVYGVLGVATSQVLPRYSSDVSVRDVFLEAGIEILSTQLFRLLLCVDHDGPLSPSWVPDWTFPRATESIGYSTKSLSLYKACGSTFYPANVKVYETTYTLEDDNRSLVLPGTCTDTIESIGETFNEEPFVFIDENRIRGSKAWLHCIAMVKAIASYPTGETTWDAFWQTLAAGKEASLNAKAPQDYSEVLSLIADESVGQKLHIAGQPHSPRRQKGFFTLKSLASRKPKQTLDDMRKAFRAAMQMRRFAITKKGYFCLVPRGAKIGDVIVVFETGHVPFVVRKESGFDVTRSFQLIGESYVHGIMQGEALDSHDVRFESIKLV